MTENTYPSYSTIKQLSLQWAGVNTSNLKSKFRFTTFNGKFQCKVNSKSELECDVKNSGIINRYIKWKINNNGLTLVESRLYEYEMRLLTAALEDDLGSNPKIKMDEYNKRLNKIRINNYPSDEVSFTFSNKKYKKFECITNFIYNNTLWCRSGIANRIYFNVKESGLSIKENNLKSEDLDDIINAIEKEFGVK
jgi:hypothetical protein